MNQTGQAPDLRTMQHLQELSASGVNALNSPTASVSSLQTPSMPYGQIQPSPRVPSNTLTPSIGNSSPTVAPTPSVPTAPPLPPSNLGGVNGNHLGQKSSPGAALSLLAEASLAAELDGRTGLTGLDPHFRLSSLTGALAFASAGSESAPGADQLGAASEPPALLTKRIIDPTTAVELFRLFFDFCYLHLRADCS